MMRVGNSLLAVLLALVMAGCSVEIQGTASSEAVYLDNIPAFSGEPYVVIGDIRISRNRSLPSIPLRVTAPWTIWGGATRPTPAWGWI